MGEAIVALMVEVIAMALGGLVPPSGNVRPVVRGAR